jgi:hypothetical protein
MTIGSFIEGAVLLVSIGLNGLAIWFVKDYARMMDENEMLHHASIDQGEHIEELLAENKNLKAKITPWNKGKSGYKHKPRTKKVKGPFTIGEYADYADYTTTSELAQADSANGGYTSESTL